MRAWEREVLLTVNGGEMMTDDGACSFFVIVVEDCSESESGKLQWEKLCVSRFFVSAVGNVDNDDEDADDDDDDEADAAEEFVIVVSLLLLLLFLLLFAVVELVVAVVFLTKVMTGFLVGGGDDRLSGVVYRLTIDLRDERVGVVLDRMCWAGGIRFSFKTFCQQNGNGGVNDRFFSIF